MNIFIWIFFLSILYETKCKDLSPELDFDIYSRLATPKVITKKDSIDFKVIGQSLVSNIGNIGGLAFLGFQVYHHIKNFVGLPSNQYIQLTNSSALDKLEKEVEELWRVVHNLHQGQSSRIDTVDDKLNKLDQLETDTNTIRSNVNLHGTTLNKLSDQISKIKAQLELLEVSQHEQSDKIQSISIQNTEFNSKFADELKKIRTTEIPLMIKQHDEMMLGKLQKFGDSIKKLVTSTKKDRDKK